MITSNIGNGQYKQDENHPNPTSPTVHKTKLTKTGHIAELTRNGATELVRSQPNPIYNV